MPDPVDINDYVNALPYDVGTQDAIYDAFYAPNRRDMESRISSLSIPNNLKHEIWNARVAVEKGQPYDFKAWTSMTAPQGAPPAASPASQASAPPATAPPPSSPNYFGALKRGMYNAAERVAKSAENLSQVLPYTPVTGPGEMVAGAISKLTGMPTPTDQGRAALGKIGEASKKAASEQKTGNSIGEMVAEGAGAAPLDIARYTVAQRLGLPGPMAMALTDALYESDKGFQAAVEAAVKGGITGKAMSTAKNVVGSAPIQKALTSAIAKYPQLNSIIQGLAQGGAAGLVGYAANENPEDGGALKSMISNAILGAGLSAAAPKTTTPPSASSKKATPAPAPEVGVATAEPPPKPAKASAAVFMANERASKKSPKPTEPPPVIKAAKSAPMTPLTDERFAPPVPTEQAAPPKSAKASAAAFMAADRAANKTASEYKLPQLEEAVKSITDPAKRELAMKELRSIIGESEAPVASETPVTEAPAKSAKASAAAIMAREREAKQTEKDFKLNELDKTVEKTAATPEGRKQLAEELRGILGVLDGEQAQPSITVTDTAPKVEPVMAEMPTKLETPAATVTAPAAPVSAPLAATVVTPEPVKDSPAPIPVAAKATPAPAPVQTQAADQAAATPVAQSAPPPVAPTPAPAPKATLTEVPNKRITYRDEDGVSAAYTPEKNELIFKAGDRYYSVTPKKGEVQIIDIMKNPDEPFITGPMSGTVAETAAKLLGLDYEPIRTEVPPSTPKGNAKAKPSTAKKEAGPAPTTSEPPSIAEDKTIKLPKSKEEIKNRLRPIMNGLSKLKDRSLAERIGELSDEWYDYTNPPKGITISLLEAIEQAEADLSKGGKKK